MVRVRMKSRAAPKIVRVRTIFPLGLCWRAILNPMASSPKGDYLKCYLFASI